VDDHRNSYRPYLQTHRYTVIVNIFVVVFAISTKWQPIELWQPAVPDAKGQVA
jgi:hypothetical protein